MKRTPWTISREMFLSLTEVESLLAHVRKAVAESAGRPHISAILDQLIIEGLLFSGLRNSELCTLRLADTIIGQHESVFVVRNGQSIQRIVHVPAALSDLVSYYVSEARSSLLSDDVDPHDFSQPLVINERGHPYERTGLYRRVVRILSHAGLSNRASVQLLRHTYGYLAYLKTGGNLLFVQRQLGHAHPIITSIYAQFVEESYSNLAEKLFCTVEPHFEDLKSV